MEILKEINETLEGGLGAKEFTEILEELREILEGTLH